MTAIPPVPPLPEPSNTIQQNVVPCPKCGTPMQYYSNERGSWRTCPACGHHVGSAMARETATGPFTLGVIGFLLGMISIVFPVAFVISDSPASRVGMAALKNACAHSCRNTVCSSTSVCRTVSRFNAASKAISDCG